MTPLLVFFPLLPLPVQRAPRPLQFVRSLHRMHYERERERHKQRAENVPALERQDSRDRKFQLSKRQRDGKEKAHIKALLSYVSPTITS